MQEEGPPSDQPVHKKGRATSVRTAPDPRSKSVNDRLNWNGKQGGGSEGQNQQIWRPTGRVHGTPAKTMDYQCSEDSQLNQSKRRRSSTSGEKSSKRTQVDSGESKHHSPSVFERLGISGEGRVNGDKRGSNEKTK